MRFLTATRLKQLGLDCWPVKTPAFVDELSNPGFESVRSVELMAFPSEAKALEELSKSKTPRFIFDIAPQEVAQKNNPLEDREPKDWYYVRAALGPVPKPTPDATLEVFKRR